MLKTPSFLLVTLVSGWLAPGFLPRMSAHEVNYVATLTGNGVLPPNASPGTGLLQLTYDHGEHLLRFAVTFGDLQGGVTESQLRGPTGAAFSGVAGVAISLDGFPAGLTAGSYSNTLDLTAATSFDVAFLIANGGTAATAEHALADAMGEGAVYLHLATQSYPDGELRGFLVPAPETIPAIAEIAVLDANRVVLHFDTEQDRSYTLEYTEALTGSGPWVPLYAVPNQPFSSHYIVADASTNRHRFYRLVAVP